MFSFSFSSEWISSRDFLWRSYS